MHRNIFKPLSQSAELVGINETINRIYITSFKLPFYSAISINIFSIESY